MESSQFSYEAPGSSYESASGGGLGPGPPGAPGPPPAPQSVPSLPTPWASAPDGLPVPIPATPPSPSPTAAPPPPAPAAPPYAGAPPAAPPYAGSYPAFSPVGYPPYSGAIPSPYPLPPSPRLVRHTLHRRTWLWVVLVTAILAASLGGLIGAIVGANTQQTIILKYFPNKSALSRPQDVQEVLAKVEPAVVSIDSESAAGGGAAGGDFAESAGSGMILTSGARS